MRSRSAIVRYERALYSAARAIVPASRLVTATLIASSTRSRAYLSAVASFPHRSRCQPRVPAYRDRVFGKAASVVKPLAR